MGRCPNIRRGLGTSSNKRATISGTTATASRTTGQNTQLASTPPHEVTLADPGRQTGSLHRASETSGQSPGRQLEARKQLALASALACPLSLFPPSLCDAPLCLARPLGTNLQVRSFNSSCLALQRESVFLQEHLHVCGSCTNKCFLRSEQGPQGLQKGKRKDI